MKKYLSILSAVAAALIAAASAQAAVVCNNCAYEQGGVATFLGAHSPLTEDNSTFGNATTGTNGNFTNWWVFKIDPAGDVTVNAIFLPINNISNFDVQLFDLTAQVCGPNTLLVGGVCTTLTANNLLFDGFTSPQFATVIDFNFLDAGYYAFKVTGTISGLGETQPASYVGNVQVAEVTQVPEPGSLLLAGLGLLGLGIVTSRKA